MNDERDRLTSVYETYRSEGVQRRWAAGNPGNAAMVAELRASMSADLDRCLSGLDRAAVLDFGCGSDSLVPGLARRGGRRLVLAGVDILFERLSSDGDGHGGPTHDLVVCGDGTRLPFADHAFDVVVVSTVFSSILDDVLAAGVSAELRRVLRPGGSVLWYDMRRPNPANRHLRPMTLRRIRALFPGWRLDLRPITLLPPLARRLGARTATLYPRLGSLRVLRSHLTGTIRTPGAPT